MSYIQTLKTVPPSFVGIITHQGEILALTGVHFTQLDAVVALQKQRAPLSAYLSLDSIEDEEDGPSWAEPT